MNRGLRVYLFAECDEDGNCPCCHADFGECECPDPTQDDEFEHDEQEGVFMARRLPIAPERDDDD
ncbi:MAG: hypothetical protein WKG03_00530 [Telluria sp.]